MWNRRFGRSNPGGACVSFRHTRDIPTRAKSLLACLVMLVAGLVLVPGCYRTATPTPTRPVLDEQLTVDRATIALERMRTSGHFSELGKRLATAKGVMIFPRVYKAALLLGGSGGHGVLLSRDDSGTWSAPAFFSLGGGSAGLELGYEEASVVMVFTNRAALLSAVERGLTLGADATVAAGSVGYAGANATATAGRDVYTFVDVGGVFAGVGLDGAVVAANESRNSHYYGSGATTYRIVIDRAFDNPDSRMLRAVLSGG